MSLYGGSQFDSKPSHLLRQVNAWPEYNTCSEKKNGKLLRLENLSLDCHPHCTDKNDIGNNNSGKKGCKEDSTHGRKG